MTQEVMRTQESMPVVKPALDIQEREDGYHLLVDLPGVAREDLDIDLTDRLLTIKGARPMAADEEEHRIDTHFAPCTFRRTLNLGEEIDQTNIKANLTNGVLEMHLPRIPEVQPRKIEIQAN